MSVNYSAKLGYGFMVHADELVEMKEHGVELYRNFLDNDYTVCLDNYVDFPTDYFFGLTIFNLDAGEAISIPNVRYYDKEKFAEMMDMFKQYCPNRDNYIPKDYMLFCID